MRKRFRIYTAGRHLLQSIIANSGGSIQPFINVARLQHTFRLRTMRPYTGVAIGLQLERHGELIPGRWITLLQRAHLSLRPQNILHMMPEFMC